MSRKTPKMPPAAVSAAMTDATVAAPVPPVAPKIDPVVPEAEAPAIVVPTAAPVVSRVNKAAESVTPAADQAAPAQKEDVQMATQFETPKILTDAGDRARAAFEKSQTFAAEFGDFSKGNIEAMVESGKIAAKGFETLGQDNADYTRRSFEGLTATVKSLGSIKSPTDFFKLQGDYMRSAFDAAVAQTSKNTEAMIKLASDAAQPISNRFAVAVEKVKTAA